MDRGSDRDRRTARLLLAVAALSAVPRLVDAALRPIDYNGYWHVFIARNLPREWRRLPHPPLFLILLRAADAVSRTVFSYRFVSLVCGVAAVYLVGRILAKLDTRPAVAVLGALAMALAGNAITLSNEVQSYALAIVLILASFFFFLDLVAPEPEGGWRSRVGFAAFASLALCAHYFAGLSFGACVAAPAALALARPDYRRALAASLPRRGKADAVTLALPAAVGALLYALQAKAFVQPLGELPGFYFEPGRETASSFVVRNLRSLVNWFSPVAFERARWAVALLVLFLAAVLWAAATDRSGGGRGIRRAAPAAVFAILLAAGVACGLAGLYPFGGWMRQQFLLFLFGLLAAGVALDRLLDAAPAGLRAPAVALCGAGLAANFALHLGRLLHPDPDPMLAKLAAFDARFPGDATVHVDQFHLVAFFVGDHAWDWRFAGSEPGNASAERYELRRADGRRRTLVAYRDWWTFDFGKPGLYRELAGSLGRDPSGCEELFAVDPTLYKPVRRPPAEAARAAKAAAIAAGAVAEGFVPRRVEVTADGDVFGQICLAASPQVRAVVPPGTAAGRGFQVQPRGDSALSVYGTGFRRGAAVVLGGRRLETTFGNGGWITASVPADLYAKPGRLTLTVVDPFGRESNAVEFEVAGK